MRDVVTNLRKLRVVGLAPEGDAKAASELHRPNGGKPLPEREIAQSAYLFVSAPSIRDTALDHFLPIRVKHHPDFRIVRLDEIVELCIERCEYCERSGLTSRPSEVGARDDVLRAVPTY